MSWLAESKEYTERMNRAYGKLKESVEMIDIDKFFKSKKTGAALKGENTALYRILKDDYIILFNYSDGLLTFYVKDRFDDLLVPEVHFNIEDIDTLEKVYNKCMNSFEAMKSLRESKKMKESYYDDNYEEEELFTYHPRFEKGMVALYDNKDCSFWNADQESFGFSSKCASGFNSEKEALDYFKDVLENRASSLDYDDYDGSWVKAGMEDVVTIPYENAEKFDESKLREKNEFNPFNDVTTSYYGLYRTLCDKYGEEKVAQMVINHMNCDTKEIESALYEIGQENGIFLNYDDFEDKFMFFEESKMKEAKLSDAEKDKLQLVFGNLESAINYIDNGEYPEAEDSDMYNDMMNAKDILERFLAVDIRESKMRESEDGWNEGVLEECGDVLDRIYDLTYEIKNCIKGAYTDCHTYEELADYIRGLADDLRDAADGVAYCCDDEDDEE